MTVGMDMGHEHGLWTLVMVMSNGNGQRAQEMGMDWTMGMGIRHRHAAWAGWPISPLQVGTIVMAIGMDIDLNFGVGMQPGQVAHPCPSCGHAWRRWFIGRFWR